MKETTFFGDLTTFEKVVSIIILLGIILPFFFHILTPIQFLLFPVLYLSLLNRHRKSIKGFWKIVWLVCCLFSIFTGLSIWFYSNLYFVPYFKDISIMIFPLLVIMGNKLLPRVSSEPV